MSLSGFALVGAALLDVVVGEPPERLHPVAWFGRVAGRLDRTCDHPRLVGTLASLALSLVAAVVVAAVVVAAGRLDALAGAGVGALALFTTTSLRRLLERAREVTALVDDDVDAARDRLRTLAGRDAATLSPGQIRSGVAESLAENLADGLIAPLVGFALLSVGTTSLGAGPVLAVAVGCGGAAWVKAVNTLDSMLGYHSTPVGWGPAKLDDVVMWLPARLTACLLAVVSRAPLALLSAYRWQDDVASPNAGWPMGTLAAILDVRLEKPGAYVLNPEATLPDAQLAGVAVRKVALTGVVAYAVVGVVTWS